MASQSYWTDSGLHLLQEAVDLDSDRVEEPSVPEQAALPKDSRKQWIPGCSHYHLAARTPQHEMPPWPSALTTARQKAQVENWTLNKSKSDDHNNFPGPTRLRGNQKEPGM